MTSRPDPSLRAACRKTSNGSNFFDTQSDWPAIVEIATRQHGCLTTQQLRTVGMAPATLSSFAAAGRLHRIHHGVYALTPTSLLTPHGRYMAAVLACGPLAALSFQPAAYLLGLQTHRPSQRHVTVPAANGRARPGIKLHRSKTLRTTDTTHPYGIPTTTPARTIFDLAGILQERPLQRLLDQALHRDLLDMTAILDQIDRNRGRTKNVGALNKTLETHTVGSTPTWNDFEELFLQLVLEIDLPKPEVQAWLDLDDGELPIRPDFMWRDRRLIIETDGWDTHGGPTPFEDDRRRDQRAAAAGFQTLRVTWRQLTTQRRRLQRTLLKVASSALASARSSEAA